MARLKSFFGYAGAVFSLVVLALAGPVLFPALTHAIAATGVKIAPVYTGGEVVRTIDRGAWHVDVYRAVEPRAPLDRAEPFVQLAFAPLSALPAHVEDAIDLDGDGKPDLRVRFDVPADPKAKLKVDVESLSPRVKSLSGVSRASLYELIARLPESVVVRIPLAPQGR